MRWEIKSAFVAVLVYFATLRLKGRSPLRERDTYLLGQLHRASYSWESNALPVTTLIYPLKAWEFTWHFETATHTLASPARPSPASSFTVHWAHLQRLVLLFNWELLWPGSTCLSPEHGVTHTPSNNAQDKDLSATQKDISTPDLTWDCTPKQQVRRKLFIQCQAEMGLSGPIEEQTFQPGL